MLNERLQPAATSFSMNAAILGVAGLALVSYFKGWNSGIQVWGQPYWVINYSDGLIRRAFLGNLFSLFYDPHDVNRLWPAVLTFHTAISVLTVFTLLLWLRACLRENNALLLLSIAGVFATSQFLPTLAYNTGYLDAPLYLLLVLGAACVASGVYWPAFFIGLVGPFVHDSFVFLWATLALLMFWDNRSTGVLWRVALLAAAILSTAAMYFLPSREAAMAQLSTAPLPGDVRSWMVEVTSVWSIREAMTVMVQRYANRFPNFLLSLLFFGFSTAMMVGTYGVLRSLRPRHFSVLILASCAPATILALGWDLSRFLVATALSAFVAILFMETRSGYQSAHPLRTPRLYGLLPAWGTAVLFFLLPLTYVYFGRGNVIDAGILPFGDTVLGQHLKLFVEGFYSSR